MKAVHEFKNREEWEEYIIYYFSVSAMQGILSQMEFKEVPIHEEIKRIVDSSVVYAQALKNRLAKH